MFKITLVGFKVSQGEQGGYDENYDHLLGEGTMQKSPV